MISRMNALYRIASQLEEIDPIVAYEFLGHVRNLVATGRRFILELTPMQKTLSHPSDRIELSENSSGGWDLTHMNVDGKGTRNVVGWRLKPSEILKVIESSIVPGPMTDEVKAMLEQEVAAGDVGIPRGAEMGGGPSALPEPDPGEVKGGISVPHPWQSDFSIWDTGVASRSDLSQSSPDHPQDD